MRTILLTLILFAPALSPADRFFERLGALCGERFVGEAVAGDAFRGEPLVAEIAHCNEREIRIPFAVGEDRSRTWILRRLDDGRLEFKHDHRHEDGTPDEITMYGGTSVDAGSASRQAFPADRQTAELIPEASTNEWFLELSEDGRRLTYYLERHSEPRFKAVLER